MWVKVNIALNVIAQERDRKWRKKGGGRGEKKKKTRVDLSLGG